ncbi:MAG: tRNA 2-thiouridine(34) synthase MnmA [Myxococcota bacterium]
MKVVVAMSGGVDSSAVAGLMVEQGHEVIGLAMKTHDLEPKQNRACCTPDDMRDARRVADTLGIPFYVLNYADVFRERIIEPFAQAYLRGETPNPCVECNDKVKFRPMLKRAKVLGADRLVTGHYARIERVDGEARLLRGVDDAKDQSYFLYRLNAAQLAELDFPLGGMTKDQVREHARRFGLPVAEKHESQEICFVGAEGYAATVEKIAGRVGRLGPILNQDGETLGQHQGVHRYTHGQRRGLGISSPEPLYVTNIDAESGAVHVGPKSALETETVVVGEAHWIGSAPEDGTEVLVQQRYREKPKSGKLEKLEGGGVRVHFDAAQGRGAPGQACVIYQGDRVLGGGTIVRPSTQERS